MSTLGACKTCGRATPWEDKSYVDEDGHWIGDYAQHCDSCIDVMAERGQKMREWDYYHPDAACPEVELPQLPKPPKKAGLQKTTASAIAAE